MREERVRHSASAGPGKGIVVSGRVPARWRAALLAVSLGILLAGGAPAQQGEQVVNVRNVGAFSCDDFIVIVEAPDLQLEKTAFMQWTAAYATAAARSNSLIDVFPLGDTWELVRMTRLVCLESRSANYETALRMAIGRLRPFWITSQTDVLNLEDPEGREVQFYQEAVLPLQAALKKQGLALAADGVFGNQTGGAIQAVNRAQGRQRWSTPDGDLLYQLTQ